MTTIARLINGFMTGMFDILCLPFRSLSAWWPLVVISFLTGVFMLWLFGKVSDQETIRVVRDKIRGNLIGIRLFGDDMGLLLRLQGRIFAQTLTYLRYAAVPFLIMLLPVVLIMIQLELRFSLRPFTPGELTVVTVRVADPSILETGVSLDAPEGVTIETPGVRSKVLREVSWRLRIDEPGTHVLTVNAGVETEEKELIAGTAWKSVSPLRSANFLEALLYPGEKPISSKAVESIAVTYPSLPLKLFGWNLYWMIPFFILSLAFGFALRRPLGVEI